MALSKSNPKKTLAVVDWNAFLQESDPEPEADNKGSTRRKVVAMGNSFKKYRPLLSEREFGQSLSFPDGRPRSSTLPIGDSGSCSVST